MALKKITDLPQNSGLAGVDLMEIVNDPNGTPASEKSSFFNLLNLITSLSPRGFLINGKIVPSVSSNNLTVAIKGLDGNDPSASNPVYCRIGDDVRSITSALSVTKNAGTNWFNAGGNELAVQEVDYFVYLGYNATDGVTIGFARIPYANEYGEFSASSTNEKYCAISDISNANPGDDYELIGRFAATLSAGAGYTWTVPTFTNINLIQRKIYETRWLSYTPIWKGSTTNPSLGNGTAVGYYIVKQNSVELKASLTSGSSTTYGSGFYGISIPFTAVNSATIGSLIVSAFDLNALLTILGIMGDATTRIWGYNGRFGPTVPFTFTEGDSLFLMGMIRI